MEELLRFLAIRAADRLDTRPDPDRPQLVALRTDSDFQRALKNADDRLAVARGFVAGDQFLKHPGELTLGGALLGVRHAVEKASGGKQPAPEVAKILSAALLRALPDVGRDGRAADEQHDYAELFTGLRTRVEAPRRFLFCSVRIQANLTSGRAADEWGRSWYGSLRETGFSPL
jgi:hypothetical protein